jgi:hypothetical protein
MQVLPLVHVYTYIFLFHAYVLALHLVFDGRSHRTPRWDIGMNHFQMS